MATRPLAVIKGAGDLATGVAVRLHRAGFDVVMTEIARPTVVRRTVSFAEAVFEGRMEVDGIEAVLVDTPGGPGEGHVSGASEQAGLLRDVLAGGRIAVVVDPDATVRSGLDPVLLVDAIVAKKNLGTRIDDAPAVAALGPGFTAGVDVHAVVETMRGHDLGRVLYEGAALPNTGVPGQVGGFASERVLRAPGRGVFTPVRSIGDRIAAGDVAGRVDGDEVVSQIDGIIRGLLHEGIRVTEGFKVGDVDARAESSHCFTVSDKALAVGGGVLEAAGALLGGFLVAPGAQR